MSCEEERRAEAWEEVLDEEKREAVKEALDDSSLEDFAWFLIDHIDPDELIELADFYGLDI